jgi:hypothetical protein
MEAVNRAVAASAPSVKRLHVCVRSPDDHDNVITFTLGSYQEVTKLAREIEELGYELKLLHPILKHCDFVLEPQFHV